MARVCYLKRYKCNYSSVNRFNKDITPLSEHCARVRQNRSSTVALQCSAVVHSAPSSVTREVVLISPVKLCAPVSLTPYKVSKIVIVEVLFWHDVLNNTNKIQVSSRRRASKVSALHVARLGLNDGAQLWISFKLFSKKTFFHNTH